MANAKQQETMLLTEHFSWPPISLIDDIINAVNEVLYRCTDSFETGLSSADPALLGFADLYASQNRTPQKDEDGNDVYPEARLEIEEGVLKLETLMENAVDKNFDKLEIWTLRNVFALGRGKGEDEGLGDWVRLGHYENLQPPPKDSNLTPEALYALRRKLLETQKLHAALVAEKTRNEAQIARLKALVQPPLHKRETNSTSATDTAAAEPVAAPFAFLTHTPAARALGLQPPQASSSSNGSTSTSDIKPSLPLTTHTSFAHTQLPHLRHLLASLKPHLSSTTSAAIPGGSSSTTLAPEQRRLYIESQAKRALERKGVDTLEGVEGVWDVGVTRLRGEEVKGLESLVTSGVIAKGAGVADKRIRRNEEAEEEEQGEAMDTT